ncbi:hypothetical protein [Hymenobacter psychrotolerans]|uniref:Uncharacterized protein n=1 Tax=Hymenobacter psychrotolerans DSM 18569 TaxID=1121959 RepID=A0A1M6Z8E6_9BACT|nr:hypothetical protein [Hymenobacter psychrotolerans]SHL26728.1 hypothetical protein SAMN02746009_02455 [Hymenobacter psychrotolerans DSM 18569]
MDTETPEQKIARLEAENAQLKQDNATAEEAIGDLSEKLSNAEAATPTLVVVTHDKTQYQVLAQQFNYEGTEVKAKDLQKNKEVLAALVKTGSGLLRKV